MGSTVLIPADLADLFRPRPYHDLSWQDDALCAQVDHALFYPDKGGSAKEAKQVCLACPVQAQCLRYALGTDDRFGVWGAMSERERRKIRDKGLAAVQQTTWSTVQSAEYHGIDTTHGDAVRSLRRMGLTPVAGPPYRWDPEQVRNAQPVDEVA